MIIIKGYGIKCQIKMKQNVKILIGISYVSIRNDKVLCILGVKIRNLKADFKIGGTWREVRQ